MAVTLREALEAVPLEHAENCRWMQLSGEYNKGRSLAPLDEDCDCFVAKVRAALDAPVQGSVSAKEVLATIDEHPDDLFEASEAIAALVAERWAARERDLIGTFGEAIRTGTTKDLGFGPAMIAAVEKRDANVQALVDVAERIASAEADLSLPQFRNEWRARLRAAIDAVREKPVGSAVCPECHAIHMEGTPVCRCGACPYRNFKQVPDNTFPIFECKRCGTRHFWD